MIEMVLTMALQLIGWAIQMIGMFINPICQLVFGMDYSELLQASLIDVIQMVTLKDLLIVMAYFRLSHTSRRLPPLRRSRRWRDESLVLLIFCSKANYLDLK